MEGGRREERYDASTDSEDENYRDRHEGNKKSHFTLSSAGKMLRRRIPEKSRLLMVPKRLWMQTVPTKDCDIVLLFASGTGEATINWLASCFRNRLPEIRFNIKTHKSGGKFAFYITATMDGFVKGAEDLKLKKRTKPEYGNDLRELTQAELSFFYGVEDPSTFFTSQERQSIVHYLLTSIRAHEGDTINDIKFRPGQSIVSLCQLKRIIEQILPLHDQDKLKSLRTSWVQSLTNCQPLDDIQEYFGSKIGIYFAWLGFYNTSLIVPAVIGALFWFSFWGKDQAKEDKAFVVFSFINVIWGSTWLEAWKRHSCQLTFKWGTQDINKYFEDPRPEFRGELKRSKITGRIEPTYPRYKRNIFRCLVTVPVILSCVLAVGLVMFFILYIQDWWDAQIEQKGLPSILSYIPKFGMAISITAFDEGYARIATLLNDKENHRNVECYDNNLIIKLALFRVVNSFLALFYIAFYLQDMEILKDQLIVLFLTRQIVGNIKESCIPYLQEQLKLANMSFDLFGGLTPSDPGDGKKEIGSIDEETKDNSKLESTDHNSKNGFDEHEDVGSESILQSSSNQNSKRAINQAEIECNMSKYDDTLEDYLEMFIQFGYVMLFSSAFPLAAACAFANNLIEIRSDAFKLCCVFQRPFGHRVNNIGVWQDAMEFMCILGIMVNCCLIGLSGQVHRMFPEMSTTQTILLIIVLEHIMIALKYCVSYSIPNIPTNIHEELQKAEFRRREAFTRLYSLNSQDNSKQSTPTSEEEMYHHDCFSKENRKNKY